MTMRQLITWGLLLLITTPIADVRLLVEHDGSMVNERALYFMRLWKPNDQAKWQPLAMKLVRTAPEGPAPPQIVW